MTPLDLSLGELQSLCLKATRGAGRAVGVAEDAGRAVRWLHARELDGAGALVALLRATDRQTVADLAPVLPTLTPAQVAVCPLALGGYLSDMGALPDTPLGPVWTPVLLLPLLADLAPHGVDVAPVTSPAVVRLRPCRAALPATQSRAQVDSATMEALLAFAARTYAPATAASRASGAGSGLSDND